MNRIMISAVSLVLLPLLPNAAFCHCEIPCGIYHDETRIELIREHIETIEKSMKMITELSVEGHKNYNQLIRWVMNKETHADYIQEIVCQYFMTQRVKPVDSSRTEEYEAYVAKIRLLHNMLTASMKAKQTTDIEHVEKLRSLLEAFNKLYFEK